jgi:2-aminoethylphosphonate-pyruvate transaminase
MNERTILLNPGPVTLSPGVRDALTRGDWCHREQEFADLTQSINRRLVKVYDADSDEYASILLTGSGTCAVESMLVTLAPEDSSTLVIANGVYGERMANMLTEHGRPHKVFRCHWTAPIDFEAVERQLDGNDQLTHVVAVQHETTTGRLNEIERLGRICARRHVALLLDSVSAFGAEELRFDEWNIEALAATANKCLHGVPGISFVIAKRSSLSHPATHTGSVYMDLRNYYGTQHGDGYSPFTLSVQCAFALDVALDEFAESGGWRGRHGRYAEIAAQIRDHLQHCGVEPLLQAEECSVTMHSYLLPATVDYKRFHDVLKEDGFIVYAGQGNLAGKIFRIAHMGAILDDDVDRLTRSLTRALEA